MVKLKTIDQYTIDELINELGKASGILWREGHHDLSVAVGQATRLIAKNRNKTND